MSVFLLIVGVSGSGKTTLISHIKQTYPEVVFPPSYTTRAKRPGEKSGEDYVFISREIFEKKINRNEFLEWAEYGGNLYGTDRASVYEPLQAGRLVVKQAEVQGARQLVDTMSADHLKTIFIDAGAWPELEARIVARAPMSKDELLQRKARYEDEMSYKKEANYVIHNTFGHLDAAIGELDAIIEKFIAF